MKCVYKYIFNWLIPTILYFNTDAHIPKLFHPVTDINDRGKQTKVQIRVHKISMYILPRHIFYICIFLFVFY